jgi:hypothetical protein
MKNLFFKTDGTVLIHLRLSASNSHLICVLSATRVSIFKKYIYVDFSVFKERSSNWAYVCILQNVKILYNKSVNPGLNGGKKGRICTFKGHTLLSKTRE